MDYKTGWELLWNGRWRIMCEAATQCYTRSIVEMFASLVVASPVAFCFFSAAGQRFQTLNPLAHRSP